MEVTISMTKSDNDVMNKRLFNDRTVECELMNTNMLNPKLKLSADFLDYNYVWISKFKRFYFVTSVDVLPGNHIVMSCHIDTLMTYKAQIAEMEVHVVRNEDIGLNEVRDNLLDIEEIREVVMVPGNYELPTCENKNARVVIVSIK